MPSIHSNGISLFFERRGQWPAQRTPLLCIPGLGNDGTRWERVLPHLEQRLPLIVLDNRGAGRSDAPDALYTVQQMATDAMAVLERLELARVHVLGHSMGGFIAQELAASQPQLVAGCILASTTSKMTRRDHLLLRQWRDGFALGVDARWMLRDIFLWMYPPACFEEPDFMEQVLREALEAAYPQTQTGMAGQVAACIDFDGRQALANIHAPTLVLHGEQDLLIPLEAAQSMASTLPKGRLQIIPGAGHLPQQQMPELFARHVQEFLDVL